MINELDNINRDWNNPDFGLVKEIVERSIYADHDIVIKNRYYITKEHLIPRVTALRMITGWARALVISGDYHLHRGFLDPMGPGHNLTKMYSDALRELVDADVIGLDDSERLRVAIGKEIREVG